MKTICILSHSHLCRNPRVVKEAHALAEAGHRVEVLTVWSDSNQLREDRYLYNPEKIAYNPSVNIIKGQTSPWTLFKTRLAKKVAAQGVRYFKLETIGAIGYGYNEMLRKAIDLKADLYICHQEMPTVVGCKLIQRGFRVAFDFEDWYSHDLLPEANRSRPIGLLKKYEKFALHHGNLWYTTSQALASRLGHFGRSSTQHVIYNAFPFEDRNALDGMIKDRKRHDRISLFWFSQTIGPGRGLEELALAMNQIEEPFELHLRGNVYPGYEAELMQHFKLGQNQDLILHPLVPHHELLSRIAEHDVGLALEKSNPASRDLTITNKILQYLLGGLAVVASDTSGQLEVAGLAPESVFTFSDKQTGKLAENIRSLIKNRSLLHHAKGKALQYAEHRFSAEIESDKLKKLINQTITI